MKKTVAVELSNVSFGYKKTLPIILEDFSLKIYEGEFVALLGHNGSGKSTIAKLMAGLIEPTKGEVLIFGEHYTGEGFCEVRQNISVVFQNPDSQFIGSTVEDDIAFGLENYKFDPKDMKAIIIKQLEDVDMVDFIKAQPHNLSGGQKQKVAIAGILAISPKIILFDEATSMLDPKGARDINRIIHELHTEKGITVIAITHNMEEVINTDRVIIIEHGKIQSNTAPKEIMFNEEKLKELKLASPFAVQLSHKLMKENIISEEKITIKEVIACL